MPRRGASGSPRPADGRWPDLRPRRRHRRLPDLPPRRARPRPGDDPGLPRRPARLRGVARRDAAAWAQLAGRGRRLPRGADAPRPAQRPGPRPEQPPPPRRRAQGLLPVRLRRGPDRRRRRRPPRPAAAVPPPARDADRRRDRAPPRGGATGRCRDRAPARSSSTRPACGSARRSGSTARTCPRDGAFVRVIGKGDKERLVPVGEVALDWLGRWIDGPRAALLALHHVAPVRGGPLFLGDRGGRLARQQAWAAVKRAADRRRPRPSGSARTRCATRSRRTCSRAEPTCGSSRSCSGMRVSPPRSSTRI